MKEGIVVEHLTKQFGAFTAVDDVSFHAEDGRVTALLGPSGSGKSTVLRMIAGLERPSAGRIRIAQEDQTEASVQDRRVGFVFQHYALFRHMNVRENVSFGLSVRKAGRDETTKRVDELHRELGVTSLLVTHDQEEALELANRVVVMNHGRIEQIGTPDEIYNDPQTPFVAGFVGAANVLTGRVKDGGLRFGDKVLFDANHIDDGSDAEAFIRPHDVWVGDHRLNGTSVQATVERLKDLGWMSKLHLRLADGQTIVAHVLNEHLGPHSEGDAVWVDLRNAKVFAPAESPAQGNGHATAVPQG